MQKQCLFLGYKKNKPSLINFLKKKNFIIKNYQRIPSLKTFKQSDFILSFGFRKIISANISLTSTSSFAVGEKVIQNNTQAYGFVTFSNTSQVMLQHIVGTFNANNISSEDSEATAIVNDIATINVTIPATEAAYFSPVTYYEYENNLNEQRRTINILDRSYHESVNIQFRQQMQND